MKAIVLTSTMRRHQYVANTLASTMDVACVWQEQKSFEPLRYAGSADEEAIIARHFDARDASEHAYFADHADVRARARRVGPGGCNDAAEIEAMRALAPDVVLVFGTGLLEQPLIDSFPGRIINIHLGLSPYYRGAGTNFWPLVNGEPEYCGATIHFLDIGVDTGPIIAHVRPDIRSGDGPHDIGNKTIVAAADALATAAIAHLQAPLRGVVQSGIAQASIGRPDAGAPDRAQPAKGRLYRRKDFSAAAVERLYANFADGMIDAYLRDRAARDARLSLVAMEAHAR